MSLVTDRNGLEILTLGDALRLLESVAVGRIGFVEGDRVTILPVNHFVHGTSVLFRTAAGAKLDAAVVRRPVAFEADHWDADLRSGWSVLVRGDAEVVGEEAMVALLEARGLESWARSRHRRGWVRIRADEVTGRRLHPRRT